MIYGGRVLSWNTTRGCTVIICVQLRRERKQYYGVANLQEKEKQLVEEYPAVNSPKMPVFLSQSFALNAEGFSTKPYWNYWKADGRYWRLVFTAHLI